MSEKSTAPPKEGMAIAGYCKAKLFASFTTVDVKALVRLLTLDEETVSSFRPRHALRQEWRDGRTL